MKRVCSPAYSITVRLRIPKRVGMLSEVALAIGRAGGDVGVIKIADETREYVVRDFNISAWDVNHQREIVSALQAVENVDVISAEDVTFACHEGGKMEIAGRYPLCDSDDLSRLYTPGVARVCRAVHEDPRRGYRLTTRCNTVAVVTDGSAILGLGNLGPLAALPVMEGKALLFKQFGGVDAIPICLDTQEPDEIVAIVKAIAPTFGGINLEDISAPRCFEIERRLRDELDIPVFHDDQHGTAIVVLAALTNALKIVEKDITSLKIVFGGAGAAGVACTRLLMAAGVKNVIGCDRAGAIYKGRGENMNPAKLKYAEYTNPEGLKGSLSDVIAGADVFIGVSGPGTLSADNVKSMSDNPIVFAMSNPDPEIQPADALPYVAVMATGRSDYPNQINNVLAFPGVFRGALDCRASSITEGMKIAAANAIAAVIGDDELRSDYIIPSAFDSRVAPAVAGAVADAAEKDGVIKASAGPIPDVDDLKK
ncbi:MAG: NAD-dependent malic enzyme [Planctomycetota bacterium]|nr:NAD-dependent malic enzyme [Planctomycetota bacterium]